MSQYGTSSPLMTTQGYIINSGGNQNENPDFIFAMFLLKSGGQKKNSLGLYLGRVLLPTNSK